MTIQELITELQKVEDKDKQVYVIGTGKWEGFLILLEKIEVSERSEDPDTQRLLLY